MQRIDQMVDIENTSADIEKFQNKSEEWDAAQHHVRQVAEEGADKKPHFRSVFTHLLFRPTFDPAFKGRGRFRIVKSDERPCYDWTVSFLTRLGRRRCACRRCGRSEERRVGKVGVGGVCGVWW